MEKEGSFKASAPPYHLRKEKFRRGAHVPDERVAPYDKHRKPPVLMMSIREFLGLSPQDSKPFRGWLY